MIMQLRQIEDVLLNGVLYITVVKEIAMHVDIVDITMLKMILDVVSKNIFYGIL